MDFSYSPKEENLVLESEAFSLASLLQRAIDSTRQGSYLEGATYFTLAREQLTPSQMHFAELIDAFLQSQVGFWLAEQSLQLATKHVVEADIERQSCLLALEKQFLAFNEEANTVPHIQATTKISGGYRSQQLQQPLQLTQAGSNHPDPHDGNPSPPRLPSKEGDTLPGLYITCFGHFEVKRFDRPIVLCHSRNGQAFLRLLVVQDRYRASVDRLMDLLWAQDAPEIARRKLQIAASAARSSLNSGYRCEPGAGYILCKDGFYQINPSVIIRTDVDEFLSLWQTGRQASRSESIALYERACNLCSGPFLVEDTYADWSSLRREQLKQIYITMCRALTGYYLQIQHFEDAMKWANAILREDLCDEAAHRQVIRICIAQGRRLEALQQYYRCERILFKELSVSPALETINLLQAIQNSTDLPLHEHFPVE